MKCVKIVFRNISAWHTRKKMGLNGWTEHMSWMSVVHWWNALKFDVYLILFVLGGGDDRIFVQHPREWDSDSGQLSPPRAVSDTARHRGPLSLLCQQGQYILDWLHTLVFPPEGYICWHRDLVHSYFYESIDMFGFDRNKRLFKASFAFRKKFCSVFRIKVY